MSERRRLARRHLLTALSIGAAALASKAAQAQLLPLTWEQHQDLIWGLPANEIDHYQVFYRTPYPQSLFNQTIDALGPPPRDILQQLNANPAQTGSPLVVPAGDYTTYFPGFWPSGSQGASGSCFLRGTQIATPSGERRIEELAIGDPVITSGGVAYKIQWIVAVCARRQKQICPCVLPEDHWRPTCRMLICGCRRSTRCLSMGC
jgi:hypothetical protein